MWCAGSHLLLAARAPEGLGGAGARDPADEPFAVAVGLTAFDPTDGSVQINLGVLTATAMGSGHALIVAGQRLSGSHARGCTGACSGGYGAGTTRSAKATMLSS